MKYILIILISHISIGADYCSKKSRTNCKRSGECSWGRWKTGTKVGKFQCKARRNISATLKSRSSSSRGIASIPERSQTKAKKHIKRVKRSNHSRSIASIPEIDESKLIPKKKKSRRYKKKRKINYSTEPSTAKRMKKRVRRKQRRFSREASKQY